MKETQSMRIVCCRLAVLLLALLALAGPRALHAQELPPAEPPAPLPGQQSAVSTLRLTAREVLVPTLVEKLSGEVIYGLKPSDFIIEDNGVPQKIRVQEEMDTAPVALVVAVQQGGAGVLEYDKVAKLGPLLDLFLSDGKGRAALVGFDSQPHLLHDFTHNAAPIDEALRAMDGGNGGDAILDTVSYAVDLLAEQPKEFRRVLLLVSEARDHGSHHTKPEALIRKIGASDVLVLSVCFSPARAELLHDIKDSGEERTMSMMSVLVMAVQALKKNVAKQVAHMSGGEYRTFTFDKGFEDDIARAAKHARNRYLITFSPSDLTPGLHTIRVRTVEDYGARIVARANYWLQAEQ
jgi:VWFA-related protein